jgi:hypothetical protein
MEEGRYKGKLLTSWQPGSREPVLVLAGFFLLPLLVHLAPSLLGGAAHSQGSLPSLPNSLWKCPHRHRFTNLGIY